MLKVVIYMLALLLALVILNINLWENELTISQ